MNEDLADLSVAKSRTLIFNSKEEGSVVAAGGLYAPTIRYHNGTFYIICTNVIRNGNSWEESQNQDFMVSSTDIHGGKWSDPIFFEFNGIDTSLFFDTDEKAYITGSKSPGPYTKIMIFEVNPATVEKLSEETELWTGTGGINPEGPHVYQRNGFYYLMISEGGTFEDHRVVMARSRSLLGPYDSSPENPILSAAGTDEYVQCTGHCEAFEDKYGVWWGVCLGNRMAEAQLYGLGRETFLVKGHWTEEGWLKFERAVIHLSVPGVQPRNKDRLKASAGSDLVYIRDPILSRYSIPGRGNSHGYYELNASPHEFTSPESSPTFIGKRQRIMEGASSVILSATDPLDTTKALYAGLAVYKDEHRFLLISYSPHTNKIVFQVVNRVKGIGRSAGHKLHDKPNRLRFNIRYTEKEYRAFFSIDGGEAVELGRADAMELSAKDFVGPIVGLFAVGQQGKARFEDFVVDEAI